MSEIWKDLDFIGFPNYQVSNFGNVKSFCKNKDAGKLLKPFTDTSGYLQVDLCGKLFLIHRLVAMAFIDNAENKPCVDHIDTNRLNNKVENLRWVTSKENANNKLSLKNYSKCRKGSLNHKSKTIYQYDLDLNLLNTFSNVQDAADSMHIKNTGNICSAARGERKTAYGFIWSYNKL